MLRKMSERKRDERGCGREAYRRLCQEVPNPAERLSLCLRGHDVPATLVEPMSDFLEAVAPLLDCK